MISSFDNRRRDNESRSPKTECQFQISNGQNDLGIVSEKLRVACISADPRVAVNGWQADNSVRIQQSVAALTAAGCEVHLFAANLDFSTADDLKGATVHPLHGASMHRGCPSHRKASPISNRVLKTALGEHGPFDLVYEWFSLFSMAGMQFAKDRGIAGVLHFDSAMVRKLQRYRKLVDANTAERFANRCLGSAKALIADSPEVAQFLEASDAGLGKTHVVPGVRVDTDLMETDRNCERTGTFTVGYVGNLDEQHPIDELVQGFEILHRRNPQSRLLVVGGGRGQKTAEKLINSRGLSDVTTVTGCLSPHETRALQGHMDAIVVPATAPSSPSGTSDRLLEHMASGAVVIAADCELTRFVLEDGVNGILYDNGDPVRLSDTLTRLQSFPRLAQSLSEKSRQDIRQNHSWGSTCQKLLEIAHQEEPGPAETPSAAALVARA